jgi:hypothetical protein
MADEPGGRNGLGTNLLKTRLVSIQNVLFIRVLVTYEEFSLEKNRLLAMPSYCWVPKCTQHGYKHSNGQSVSFFNFPSDLTARKMWIHAIRRDEGNHFVITKTTKVCSLHFKANDIRKSLNGRLYVKMDAVPSKFYWNDMESPKKRKAPATRTPLPTKAAKMASPSTSTS